MTTPNVLIQVTVFDDETGEAKKTIVRTYDGSHYWEIERMFREIGEQVSVIVDPTGRG